MQTDDDHLLMAALITFAASLLILCACATAFASMSQPTRTCDNSQGGYFHTTTKTYFSTLRWSFVKCQRSRSTESNHTSTFGAFGQSQIQRADGGRWASTQPTRSLMPCPTLPTPRTNNPTSHHSGTCIGTTASCSAYTLNLAQLVPYQTASEYL